LWNFIHYLIVRLLLKFHMIDNACGKVGRDGDPLSKLLRIRYLSEKNLNLIVNILKGRSHR